MKTLSLKEAADYLHMHPVTLAEKAKLGVVPGAKPGRRWVFLEDDLDAYIRSLYAKKAAYDEIKDVGKCPDCQPAPDSLKEGTYGGCDLPRRAAERLERLLALHRASGRKSCSIPRKRRPGA